LLVVLVVLLLVAAAGGGVVVVRAQGRRAIFEQVRDAAIAYLETVRPDLSDAQRLAAGNILGAQAVVETNGGRTIAWREGWNFGNVTAGSSWTGAIVRGGDTEPDATGAYVPITQSFRKYDSLAQAVEDYLPGGSIGALDWRREKQEHAFDFLVAGDAAGYSAALRRAGYYTAPEAEYSAGIAAALESYA
jgi:hypothetical protein